MPRPHIVSRMSLTSRLKRASSPVPSDPHSRNSSPKPSIGDNRQSYLLLKVTVIKAQNLAAKDRNGTSDPYLVLTLGDSKQSTIVIDKSLNPEWNETFDLPINGYHCLLLEIVCWDKDRFGRDYLGELNLPLEEIFMNGQIVQEPKWYKLESRRSGKKSGNVTGDLLLQFTLTDPANPTSSSQSTMEKLNSLTTMSPAGDEDEEEGSERVESGGTDSGDQDDDNSDEVGNNLEQKTPEQNPEVLETRKKKRRIARLRRKRKQRAYEFSGSSDVAGVLFLEVVRIADLPPERNLTRTTFDMDPFVVTSLGKKIYRTRVIHHNLNPVFEEKLIFQVSRYEKNYSLNFAVIDRDKLSGNDFVGTANLPLEYITQNAPTADSSNGLYCLPEPDGAGLPTSDSRKSRFRLPMSRSSSVQNLSRLSKQTLKPQSSHGSLRASRDNTANSSMYLSVEHVNDDVNGATTGHSENNSDEYANFRTYDLPLDLKRKEKWEKKHKPVLTIRAKYTPYKALRQQFWRALLKQYDADESGKIDKVELTTMLDTLGSTLHESTIEGFFRRFSLENNDEQILTMEQAVLCLEDQLQKTQEGLDRSLHNSSNMSSQIFGDTWTPGSSSPAIIREDSPIADSKPSIVETPADSHNAAGKPVDMENKDAYDMNPLEANDLADDRGEEHIVEIRECPICHQPRLHKRSDADIITHIATCASQDWRQVNNLMMAGFVTSSQAQRKWYSKVINKVSYGGYKIGANSANILVQDRITGQINEERMSTYVRLGIRLLYKGLKSRDMEKKRIKKLLRSLSIKQGKKFDDPSSVAQIRPFINFHRLDMSEVLKPVEDFKNFNEFFYRELKPGARPCSAPEDSRIVTSPADCRSVVYNRMTDAQSIWVKGREFTIERLLGNAYPEDASRYTNGALGIFRLAPQDYHRFHIPVDGTMGEPKIIEGEYYTVNPMAIRSTLDVYGENVRVLVPIDSLVHGRVMVICVGAMMVGSTVITRKTGDKVRRAEELGYFKFGGSTLLLLFERGVLRFDDDLVSNSMGALETLVRVGMSIGHSPNRAPYTPDMRKEHVSHEEKMDAKRRIGGSLASNAAEPPTIMS